MTSTKRLLWSATGLLLTAAPSVVGHRADTDRATAARRISVDRGSSPRLRLCDEGEVRSRARGRSMRLHRACWAPPRSTTTVAAAPSTTSTTVAAAAATTTTVAATTTTTVAPTTTTTVAPTTTTTAPAVPAIAGRLANVRAGVASGVASSETPNRGFVAFFTVSNPTAGDAALTVRITATSPAGFPKYLEAFDYATSAFACRTATNAEYYRTVTTEAVFTCTGSLPADATSVITVSSGSLIAASAVGQDLRVEAVVSPGGATQLLTGTFA